MMSGSGQSNIRSYDTAVPFGASDIAGVLGALLAMDIDIWAFFKAARHSIWRWRPMLQ
jgi:hypothetical protein